MQINPTSYVQLPLTQEVNQLEISVNPFPLFPTEITVLWTVSGNGISKDGSMILPQSIIDVWGTDDPIVKEYVLEQLNLTEVII